MPKQPQWLDTKLKPRPSEVKQIQQIFRMRAEDISVAEIAEQVGESRFAVDRLLRNELVLGTAKYPAIITKVFWDKVQSQNSHPTGWQSKVRCLNCGGTMHLGTRTEKDSGLKKKYYCCRDKQCKASTFDLDQLKIPTPPKDIREILLSKAKHLNPSFGQVPLAGGAKDRSRFQVTTYVDVLSNNGDLTFYKWSDSKQKLKRLGVCKDQEPYTPHSKVQPRSKPEDQQKFCEKAMDRHLKAITCARMDYDKQFERGKKKGVAFEGEIYYVRIRTACHELLRIMRRVDVVFSRQALQKTSEIMEQIDSGALSFAAGDKEMKKMRSLSRIAVRRLLDTATEVLLDLAVWLLAHEVTFREYRSFDISRFGGNGLFEHLVHELALARKAIHETYATV